ncbi:mannitol-1-phosphate 5-dehydrogenase [Mariannaea sp. PMI_226]|nr:mannitol-1-phosphate 5-dehydrogenase [Mariannaea sp. PMI_226]
MECQYLKKAVHFGAGNIGRGFVASFLYNSGYEIVFTDIAASLVDRLNEQKTYKLIEVGTDNPVESVITNYRALNSETQKADLIKEIATASLVTCSVGTTNLKYIAPIISEGIDLRNNADGPITIIACENAIGATSTLAEYIRHAGNMSESHQKACTNWVIFANSEIDRIVPFQDQYSNLDIMVEKFREWVIEQEPFVGSSPPGIQGVIWADHLEPFVERKLCMVNTSHATAAYHGHYYGKRTIYEALQDATILKEVRKVLFETSTLVKEKYGRDYVQTVYIDQIITRISNPQLGDAVERVGRAPLRKLSRKERFIGPAMELAAYGKNCISLLAAIEMAFRFQNVKGDDESFMLARIMAEDNAELVANKVCGLVPDDNFYDKVVEIIRRVQVDTMLQQ